MLYYVFPKMSLFLLHYLLEAPDERFHYPASALHSAILLLGGR